MRTIEIKWLLDETRQKMYKFFGGNRGGKSDWIRRLMVDGPRQETEDKNQKVAGSLAYSGNFYMQSVRQSLEQRKHKLHMELDMVDTALSLCTDEAEKAIQLKTILDRLNCGDSPVSSERAKRY